MNNENIMYALLAAMSGSSNLSRKEKFREALMASFTSGNNPMSVMLNSKKFIEKEEIKSERETLQAALISSNYVRTQADNLIGQMINANAAVDSTWINANATAGQQALIMHADPTFTGLTNLPNLPAGVTWAQLTIPQLNLLIR